MPATPQIVSEPVPQAVTRSPTRIPALDGLRGLAALVMVLYHLFVAGWSDSPSIHLLQKFTTAGWVGVDLFFVLSGFLITRILLNSLDSTSFFGTFYARRALRIFPLYYLVVFFVIAFPNLLAIHWSGLQWVYLANLQNNLGFFLSRPWFRAHPPDLAAIQHLWTLGLEQQFYFAWPLVIFFFGAPKNRRNLLIASLAACAAVLALRIALHFHGVSISVLANSTPCRFDSLLYGACLALALNGALAPHHRERLHKLAAPTCLTMLATILIIGIARHTWANESPAVLTIGFTLLDIFFAALILLAIQPGSATSRVFSIQVLRTIGKYSFGLYVYHEFLREWFSAPLRAYFDATHSKLVGVLTTATILLILSFAVAVLSYHLFEQPFLRLKRFFPYKHPTT
jgi:peptidoglycan/LPS O-acetylase OafA/YrhL